MDLNLDGKIAWVAGGTGWLGQACARALAGEGARVVVSSRREDACRALADEITSGGGEALALALDTTVADAPRAVAQRIADHWGGIDILVTAMSISAYGPFLDLDRATFQASLDAKYFGYIACLQAALPVMLDRGSGAVVCITGTGGKMPIDIHMAGGSVNAALDLIVRGLATEYAANGIRINAVSPGPIDSPRRAAAREAGASAQSQIAGIPMGRLGEAAEVADAVLFLASDRASFVTGTVFTVDGGGVLTT